MRDRDLLGDWIRWAVEDDVRVEEQVDVCEDETGLRKKSKAPTCILGKYQKTLTTEGYFEFSIRLRRLSFTLKDDIPR